MKDYSFNLAFCVLTYLNSGNFKHSLSQLGTMHNTPSPPKTTLELSVHDSSSILYYTIAPFPAPLPFGQEMEVSWGVRYLKPSVTSE